MGGEYLDWQVKAKKLKEQLCRQCLAISWEIDMCDNCWLELREKSNQAEADFYQSKLKGGAGDGEVYRSGRMRRDNK